MLNMNSRTGPVEVGEIEAAKFTVASGKPSRGKYHGTLLVRWRNGNTGAVNAHSATLRDLPGHLLAQLVNRARNGDWHRTHQGLEPLYRDVWQ